MSTSLLTFEFPDAKLFEPLPDPLECLFGNWSPRRAGKATRETEGPKHCLGRILRFFWRRLELGPQSHHVAVGVAHVGNPSGAEMIDDRPAQIRDEVGLRSLAPPSAQGKGAEEVRKPHIQLEVGADAVLQLDEIAEADSVQVDGLHARILVAQGHGQVDRCGIAGCLMDGQCHRVADSVEKGSEITLLLLRGRRPAVSRVELIELYEVDTRRDCEFTFPQHLFCSPRLRGIAIERDGAPAFFDAYRVKAGQFVQFQSVALARTTAAEVDADARGHHAAQMRAAGLLVDGAAAVHRRYRHAEHSRLRWRDVSVRFHGFAHSSPEGASSVRALRSGVPRST